jgi:hypothetical protein
VGAENFEDLYSGWPASADLTTAPGPSKTFICSQNTFSVFRRNGHETEVNREALTKLESYDYPEMRELKT